jgi:hypothetical protein
MSDYKITIPPEPVGFWRFGGTRLAHYNSRPRWLTRFMMRVLLEWQWEEK